MDIAIADAQNHRHPKPVSAGDQAYLASYGNQIQQAMQRRVALQCLMCSKSESLQALRQMLISIFVCKSQQ
jgi:hypothetical protein